MKNIVARWKNIIWAGVRAAIKAETKVGMGSKVDGREKMWNAVAYSRSCFPALSAVGALIAGAAVVAKAANDA